MQEFPRTTVGGVSLSRMLIGTNWLLGWSHTSASADAQIKRRYDSAQAFKPVLEAYLRHGVDSIMAPFGASPELMEAIRDTEQKMGREILLIDTPTLNVDDNPQARREAEQTVKESARRGAKFCLLHHSCAEQLVDKNKGVIRRLDDYTKMIRDAGMIPGLSAHMPELIVYSDANGYDVETYIQIFNCMGFFDAGGDRDRGLHHPKRQKTGDDHQVYGRRPVQPLCGPDLLLERHPGKGHGHRGRL